MPASVRVQPGAALSARAGAAAEFAELRRLLARAARATLRARSVRTAEVSVTLLDDAEIAAMNAEFLQHEGPTDVISFGLYEDDEDPVADIYVGYEQALRQAAANEVAPPEELVRVTVHGVLHVLGLDHPDGADRLDSEMWRIQEQVVRQVMTG